MAAAIGLDIGRSHSTVVEWDRTAPGTVRSVGDGIRRAVPNAVREGAWGSAAVPELVLPGEMADPAELTPWRHDPWSAPFLNAMSGRLAGFVGQPGLTHRYGYGIWVISEPGTESIRLPLLAAAGLPDVALVDPAEAVLGTWAVGATSGSAADAAFRGSVVVVACGEDSTVVDAFRVEEEDRPHLVRIPGARHPVPHGIRRLQYRVVNEVLRRRVRRDLPVNGLALLAAATEYGQQLGAQPGRQIEWDGPLADLLGSPLRLSQAELDDFSETRHLVSPVRQAINAAAAASGDPRRVTVVLGGAGAGWGCLRRAAAGYEGRIARSVEPELSLAAGACYWSVVHRLARSGRAAASGPEDEGPPTVAAVPGEHPIPHQQQGCRLPPWLLTPTPEARADA